MVVLRFPYGTNEKKNRLFNERHSYVNIYMLPIVGWTDWAEILCGEFGQSWVGGGC